MGMEFADAWQGIVVHHSSTPDGTVEAFRKYHIEHNGWDDIGYHYVIEYVGGVPAIVKGREENREGAHTKGENRRSIGICIVGNFDIKSPDREIINKLVELIKEIRSRHGNLPIAYHNEYASKTCPGKMFINKEDLEKITVDKVHWAERYFNSLNEKGITIHEKRFDDNITRGEVIALIERVFNYVDKTKK